MKILNIEPRDFSEKARAQLRQLGELTEIEGGREDLLRLLPEFDVLIVRLAHRIDREVIAAATRLKTIVTATTGLNHIDLKAAEEHNIEVLSLKGETSFLDNITATAELTWGLLSLIRKIPQAHQHVLSGGWERDIFKGNELRNKTLGIVGYGRLGKMVAKYGEAFSMKIMAVDPYIKSVPDWIQLVSLEQLLTQSDIVTLHVNLNEETRGFFGQKQFQYIKNNTIFINTSRGELVDEKALLEALESGKISGAGLDVLTGETSGNPEWLERHMLWNYAKNNNNVIFTPHIGGATKESMEETELFMVKKLVSFIKGKNNEKT